MEVLNQQEIDEVSGARMSVGEAAAATVGLMMFAAASPFVIGAGAAALVAYAWM